MARLQRPLGQAARRQPPGAPGLAVRLKAQARSLHSHGGKALDASSDGAQLKALQHNLRVGLDALTLAWPEAVAFVAEGCAALRLHQRIFEALQGRGRLHRGSRQHSSR